MRSRWRWIAVSCATATSLALVISMLMTRQYTATSRIVIDPPGGVDVRAAVAVSPIYLESLKTYEQFASSDSLFQSAVAKFGLRGLLDARSIESMKKRVLKASLLRNTRILEISATLSDPKKAQGLAQFIAESTIELNRSSLAEGDQDMQRGMEMQARDLRERLQAADARWADLVAHEPVTELQGEGENAIELRASLVQQLSAAEIDAAQSSGDAAPARARRDQLRAQLEKLNRGDQEREKLLAVRMAHRDRLDIERHAIQSQLAAVETQLREARGAAPYRGERLKIIDPGIVPERPSSPNTPLNVMAAFFLGLLLPVLWFTVQMSYHEQGAMHSLAKAIDE